MQKYIETIMISATAVQALSDICDKLRDIANEDNYSEEREDDLIRQLVESGRETMKIMPTVLDIYRDLNYGEQDENNQLVANYRILSEVYNTLNSIICSDNAYIVLKDGVKWTKFDKYEEDSGYALNSVKELVVSKIYVMFRIVVDFNRTMLRSDVYTGSQILNSFKYKIASFLDVADITSLYNTLSGNKGLDNSNPELKNKVRSIMGLVDGSLPLSRKLNISEKEALEIQTITNFRLAGKIAYMSRFNLEIIDKDIELISNVAKNLEMVSANSALTLDAEMIDLYPRLYPRSIYLLAGNLELSTDFTADPSEVESLRDSNIFKNGMIKDIQDFEIFKDHFLRYNLIGNTGKADMVDVIKKADLDQLYVLFIASAIALTLATGELLSDLDRSMAIKKPRGISDLLSNNESINNLISEKIWNLKDGEDYLVLKNEILNNSLNNLVDRKQLLSRASVKLTNELLSEFTDAVSGQSAINNIVLAHRVAAQL